MNASISRDEVSRRMDLTFKLTIVEQPSNVRHELNFLGRTSIQEVKTNVFYVTDIPVRHQIWTGWPMGSVNDITLAVSASITHHHLELAETPFIIPPSSTSRTKMTA